ncbi:MAG: EMC3/TMCO1 family protein [Candidatus Altarchaeum sp.]|nr:EMC3/TMCO1 family protein [Candidatus Altarchaeum sp.]
MVFFEISESGIVIFVIAIILGLASSLVMKFTMGKDAKEARAKQKVLGEDLKAALKANDVKKAKALQSELMKSSLSSMRFSLKPMLITFIPFILVFWWMSDTYGSIGNVNFEMNVSDPDFSVFKCPLQTDSNYHYYCNSSYFNGTLKGGQTIDFGIIVSPNQSEDKTKIKINGFAKDANGGKEYILSAETITVSNGEHEKNPYYQKENKDVEITPKFLSSSSKGIAQYNFQLTNRLSGTVITLFGIELSWFIWYILIAIPFSFISGRLFKLY